MTHYNKSKNIISFRIKEAMDTQNWFLLGRNVNGNCIKCKTLTNRLGLDCQFDREKHCNF